MIDSLSVVIVNYRTPELVVACIDSLKAHAPSRVPMEIVVVDNASGDHSLACIASAHPDIRLLAAAANLGFAGGNNLALGDCRADAVLLLNSDARVEAGTLDGLIAVLDAQPWVAAVSPRIVNADNGADQDYPCRFPSLAEMLRRALGGPQLPAAGRTEPVVLERLHGACMLIRGQALAQVGLLDAGFFMYDEDVDWCLRARALGWELWLLPSVRVYHYGGRSSGRAPSGQRPGLEASTTALRMRLALRRSRYRLYRKHRSRAELLLLKLFTDIVMLLGSARLLLHWLRSPRERAASAAALRTNLAIIALNPFHREPALDPGVAVDASAQTEVGQVGNADAR